MRCKSTVMRTQQQHKFRSKKIWLFLKAFPRFGCSLVSRFTVNKKAPKSSERATERRHLVERRIPFRAP